MDLDVLQMIWDRQIPVCFQIFQDDLNFMQSEPDPVILMISRQSYFPVYFEKLLKHWNKYIKPNYLPCDIWLENKNGSTIRWNIPIGVSHDLLPISEKDIFTWNIIVHFSNFPDQDLLRWPSKEALESNFFTYIKEADFLKHRSQIVNDMQPHELKNLFQSLLNQKFDQFWKVNRSLMSHISGEPFRSIPFKIHCEDWSAVVQKIISPFDEASNPRTLEDLLSTCFNQSNQNFPYNLESAELVKKYRVLIQGIAISLVTPLQWLSEHFSTPDNFLHISFCR